MQPPTTDPLAHLIWDEEEFIKADMLSKIFAIQAMLQRHVFSQNTRLMTKAEKVDYVRWNVLALTDELHEMLHEVPWKPWSYDGKWDRERYLGELADVLHFFVNLCLVADIGPEMISLAYMRKAEKNIARQMAGYDAKAHKCLGCGRSFDDDGVTCTITQCGGAS